MFNTDYTCELYDGKITPSYARMLGFSPQGCPYRGTTTCIRCPFCPPIECDYICLLRWASASAEKQTPCRHRHECRCGWDQTARLVAWKLVPGC